MNHERYEAIIRGDDTSRSAAFWRCLLSLLSILYGTVIRCRNLWYDTIPNAQRRADVPVISVGNITMGGTGKTPMTAYLAKLLESQGKRVGILMRGYRPRGTGNSGDAPPSTAAELGQSDEAVMLQRLCPAARVAVNPNRVAGAESALAAGCNILLMDDGFQHRRLARDLNIVLVDALDPVGGGFLAPRGKLREPIAPALRRVDVIVLTRCDQADVDDLVTLTAMIRRRFTGPILRCRHAINRFVDVYGVEVAVTDPAAMQALAFAGVANFDSFAESLRMLGITVLGAYRFPDHHEYNESEITNLSNLAAELEANVVITTEKDAVKLVNRWPKNAERLLIPRVSITFSEEDAATFDRIVLAASNPPAHA